MAYDLGPWLDYAQILADTGDSNQIILPYPYEDKSVTPFDPGEAPFDLSDPSNVSQEVQYDPVTGTYYIVSKIGDTLDYRPVNAMTFDEYSQYNLDQALAKYWREKAATESEFQKQDQESSSLIPTMNVEGERFDNIFGGNGHDTVYASGGNDIVYGGNGADTIYGGSGDLAGRNWGRWHCGDHRHPVD